MTSSKRKQQLLAQYRWKARTINSKEIKHCAITAEEVLVGNNDVMHTVSFYLDYAVAKNIPQLKLGITT